MFMLCFMVGYTRYCCFLNATDYVICKVVFCDVFVSKKGFSEVPKNSPDLGDVKYRKSRENGFLESSRGVVGGILGNLVFG